MSVGIQSFGGYIPRLRLDRSTIASAHAWFNPSLKGLAKGERAMANWDEDPITMAVEAARDCLGAKAIDLGGIYMGSTSMPFQDRQNSGVVAQALLLGEDLLTLDITGSQRAGTSALVTACQAASGGGNPILVTAGQDESYDYLWEERWVRDEGYMKLVPEACVAVLKKANVEVRDIKAFCFPAAMRRVANALAKQLGIPEEAVRNNLQSNCGEAGAAHGLVMLVHALEEASPGDLILATGFGQGCDALIFQVTDAIARETRINGISGYLSTGRNETNYNRYLAHNDMIEIERGLRAEMDKQTGMTTLYRNKDMIMSAVGGKCSECGTVQFPKSGVCVNPNCGAVNTQEDHRFVGARAQLNSYTADRLTYSPDPPAYYGMVQFDEGGRAMTDITDVDPEVGLKVGMPMRLTFRVKDYDTRRGFRRYYWKATPDITGNGE